MKRKRNHTEESISNDVKKLRFESNNDYESEEEENKADLSTEEKSEEFILTREIADNAVLTDIVGRQWRIGAPVGKGSFGEIFLASGAISRAVDTTNALYVTKIEPHSNGPLFVEIHCLMNVNKSNGELFVCRESQVKILQFLLFRIRRR